MFDKKHAVRKKHEQRTASTSASLLRGVAMASSAVVSTSEGKGVWWNVDRWQHRQVGTRLGACAVCGRIFSVRSEFRAAEQYNSCSEANTSLFCLERARAPQPMSHQWSRKPRAAARQYLPEWGWPLNFFTDKGRGWQFNCWECTDFHCLGVSGSKRPWGIYLLNIDRMSPRPRAPKPRAAVRPRQLRECCISRSTSSKWTPGYKYDMSVEFKVMNNSRIMFFSE